MVKFCWFSPTKHLTKEFFLALMSMEFRLFSTISIPKNPPSKHNTNIDELWWCMFMFPVPAAKRGKCIFHVCLFGEQIKIHKVHEGEVFSPSDQQHRCWSRANTVNSILPVWCWIQVFFRFFLSHRSFSVGIIIVIVWVSLPPLDCIQHVVATNEGETYGNDWEMWDISLANC